MIEPDKQTVPAHALITWSNSLVSNDTLWDRGGSVYRHTNTVSGFNSIIDILTPYLQGFSVESSQFS